MLARVGLGLERIFGKWIPDPFVVAVGLTVLVGGAGWLATGDAAQVLDAWQGPRGFWSLLGFSMQMCLVLVTGHAVAISPPARRGLVWLSDRPRSGAEAAAMVSFVSIVLGLFNWGLGLVGGALLARFVSDSCARRGISAHGPLLAACGYVGMMAWHGGMSGSAPLKVTTRNDLVELLGPDLGSRLAVVPTSETLFSPLNLMVSLGLLFIIPWVASQLAPEHGEPLSKPRDAREPEAFPGLAGARWFAWLLVVPLAWSQIRYLGAYGVQRLDPNAINGILLTLGVALHGTLGAYARAIQQAVSGCAGIILQFPLYAGIMGIMAGTGLASAWARAAASVEPNLFLWVTFLAAGALNLLVPSGGGQWAVQGPVAAEAAEALNLPLGTVVLAVAYGDQWTNMLQPFWALPLMGLTGVRAGPLLGYTFVFLVVGGLWFSAGLWAFG